MVRQLSRTRRRYAFRHVSWNRTQSRAKIVEFGAYREERGKVIRLVGVTAGNLVPFKERNAQLSLFDEEEYEEDETQVLIDSLNRKANKKVVMVASEALKNNGN